MEGLVLIWAILPMNEFRDRKTCRYSQSVLRYYQFLRILHDAESAERQIAKAWFPLVR